MTHGRHDRCMTRNSVNETGYQALVVLGGLHDKQIRQDLLVVGEVVRARINGASWRMIGLALGVSAQAAYQRFCDADKASWEQGPLDPTEPIAQSACECPDDRCAGFHHDTDEECSCTNPV